MRTTLKRGMGRAAAGNGNGRAILPPPALSPMRVYRQAPPPRRGRLRTFARGLLLAMVVLSSVAVALAGAAYLYFEYQVVGELQASGEVKAAAQRLDVPLPGSPAIALVVGYDVRKYGTDAGGEPRSDTMMLVRADPQLKAITMLSFPRDLIVDVACPGKPTFRGRINSAYSECGAKGSLETVRQLTGLPINYLITVNFRGFRQIVDRLDGVWIDVDRRYHNDNSQNSPGFTYAEINLFPGYQKLDGARALQYVRFRHTDSDLYRVVRQQQFVRGVKDQIASSFSAFDLPKLMGAITSNVDVGVGGGKALKGRTLLSYALFAYGLPDGHFFQARLEGLEGYAELHTADSNIRKAVEEFTTPDIEAADKAGAISLGRKPKKAVSLPPRSVPVVVLNGNGVAGSASLAGNLLNQRGYPIYTPPNSADANAPSYDYFHTKVYFDPGQRGAKAAGRKVGNLFGDADVEPVPAEVLPKCTNAMLCVVVGQTFHGTLTPLAIDRTPEKQAPAVRTDLEETRDRVLPLRRGFDFKLAVPSVLEQSSYLDREMPLRVYKVGGDHKTLRLTYRTGALEYWGVQQMDWDDAPALVGKSFEHRIKGRVYAFYFNGAHLHMVVLRAGGASYWVVNTLLDSLSNETMIEIAKGLKILPHAGKKQG
jgi:LCP family protein required for cell wall assembly